MDVISHEAEADQATTVYAEVLREQLQIHQAIAITEKYDLTMIAPLGDMMWPTGDYHASESWHQQ